MSRRAGEASRHRSPVDAPTDRLAPAGQAFAFAVDGLAVTSTHMSGTRSGGYATL